MYRNFILILMLVLTICVCAQAAPPPVSIFPQPKDVQFLKQAPLTLESGRVAIVIGSKATAPEQYAAETLQKHVEKRYKQKWTIVRDNANLKAFKLLVILGQASTNKLIGSACRKLNINPSEKFPIQDGYALGVGKNVAVVAGSNPRSVIYGQDTLFQLIGKRGNSVVLNPAKIRDWPSLKHRGRVCTSADQFHSIERMDALALGRINYIDMRYGKYGTEYQTPVDHDVVKWDVREAHKRGILVYGTVYFGVQPADYDKVIAKFQEFIDCGVDGLWPYLGDPGGEGRSGTPLDLLARILALGKKHGMTGDLIHYTPGKMGYITVATKDNFAAAKVPGMADALWFFAEKPSAQSYADAKALGLNKKFVWWYHYPQPPYGFAYAGNPHSRRDNPNVYADIFPFNMAYQNPTPEEMAKAPQFLEGAMPWGGHAWVPEMVDGVFGWWAWSPESHNWQQNRRRIYDYLFNPDLVGAAFEYNDMLGQIMSKLTYSGPPMLKNEADRPECLSILAKMYEPLEKLEKGATKGSLMDDKLLMTTVLEPMRFDLAIAKLDLNLTSPESWWQANLDRILMAVREGNAAQALRWNSDAQKRVAENVKKVHETLDTLVNVDSFGGEYASRFAKRSGDAAYASSLVTLDGELNDAAWANAPVISPFKTPKEESLPDDASEVKALYGDDAVYFGFTFHESNMDNIIAKLTDHESSVWTEDSFEIFINTNGFGTPYYQFIANTLGTKFEDSNEAVGQSNVGWNGDWDVKVAKKTDRWTAEVRIPYSTLGVSKIEKDTIWLCNFARHDWSLTTSRPRSENNQEVSAWGYLGRGQLHDPAKFRPLWFK